MQEHAEGTRSGTLKVCIHCGATIRSDQMVCPKCEAAQPGHPTAPVHET